MKFWLTNDKAQPDDGVVIEFRIYGSLTVADIEALNILWSKFIRKQYVG